MYIRACSKNTCLAESQWLPLPRRPTCTATALVYGSGRQPEPDMAEANITPSSAPMCSTATKVKLFTKCLHVV